MITYSICLYLAYFTKAEYSLGPSMLLQMSECHYFYGFDIYIYIYMYIYIYIYTNNIFFVHSSVDGDLKGFHVLTIVNDPAPN